MTEMWEQVDWMNPADFTIIRLLDRDLALSPNNIAFNTSLNRKYVARRCRELHKRGVLAKSGNGDPFYTLTELGRRAAADDVSASEFSEKTHLPGDDE